MIDSHKQSSLSKRFFVDFLTPPKQIFSFDPVSDGLLDPLDHIDVVGQRLVLSNLVDMPVLVEYLLAQVPERSSVPLFLSLLHQTST